MIEMAHAMQETFFRGSPWIPREAALARNIRRRFEVGVLAQMMPCTTHPVGLAQSGAHGLTASKMPTRCQSHSDEVIVAAVTALPPASPALCASQMLFARLMASELSAVFVP
ncbi:hypothetical protein CKAH01_12486 [Colletotrichum kahawae]|uniref:Uncharacterized protein n=1 Tax=Colletotrichum kahawae TaxID=34407 RepID=A0AAD9YQR5_COLKA|nr:hypothetical protein CKAH01_12486 [Colletotrichum kahawae]